MKFKSIESILKAKKTILIFEDRNTQYLSDRYALYPIYDLPHLDHDNIFAIFDISEDKRAKFTFAVESLPIEFNYEDFDTTESLLKRGKIDICTRGYMLEPLKTSQGLIFIDKSYLRPFSNIAEGYELYERTGKSGSIYIVAKSGLNLLGIILPVQTVDTELVKDFKNLYELSLITLENNSHVNSEQMQFEENDFEDISNDTE